MTEEPRTLASEDSYLWDRTGRPDPQLQKWETALGEIRFATPIGPAPEFTARPRTAPFGSWYHGLALAAGVVLAVGTALLWYATGPATVSVDAISGSPTLGGVPIARRTSIEPGALIETDATSEARLRLARIGWLHVQRGTSLQLTAMKHTSYRWTLRRGNVRADISAPPGVFVIDVPFASAIDLGCVYDLVVEESGRSVLTVESGWVALESLHRQSLVPEGARAIARGQLGVGSPYYLDASPEFIASLAIVDVGEDTQAQAQAQVLGVLLNAARRKDALTLLTLLRRVDADGRLKIHDRLRILMPPPAGVTRAGIGAGDVVMIDLWWRALGLNFDKKPPIAIGAR